MTVITYAYSFVPDFGTQSKLEKLYAELSKGSGTQLVIAGAALALGTSVLAF